MTQKTLSSRALLELLALGLLWGASFLSIRLVLNEVSVLSSVVHRVGWAALALWLVALTMGHRIPRDTRIWVGFVGMGVLNNIVPFGLMAWALLTIESGLTSILNATTALFGVLTAALFFPDERLSLRQLGGVGIGMVAVVLVIGPAALLSFDPRAGAQIAFLVGTLSYAFAGVWARKRLSGLPPVVAAAGMLTASTGLLLPATLLMEGQIEMPTSVTGIGAIAFLSLAATAGAYMLYYRVLALAGSGNLMLVTLVIPPVAILLGTLVLGERLAWTAFVGFALLAVALIILQGKGKKPLVGAQPDR